MNPTYRNNKYVHTFDKNRAAIPTVTRIETIKSECFRLGVHRDKP